MRTLIALTLTSLLCLPGCTPPDQMGKGKSDAVKVDPKNISFPGTNKIIIKFAPKADFSAEDVKSVTITDSAIIKNWAHVLGAIPKKGPGIKAKIKADSEEYKITFFRDKDTLGTLRMKGGRLDAPDGEGWDFYAGEDKAFSKLVKDSM
ncbi:MAG: hypothetical protein P1V97_20350 [Planctomycetota bacterium]|nr:hypothetical protein [Planctomycetota bacterium]